jgi:hypothetical protein
MRIFDRFAIFDWSGAAGPRQPGIRLAVAHNNHTLEDNAPQLVEYDPGWNRAAARDWILQQHIAQENMLIGLDLSAGFPFADANAFFPHWDESPPSAPALWALVDRICAQEPHLGVNEFVRHPHASRHFRQRGQLGDLHPIGGGRLRVTEIASREQRLANPYSCLNLVGAAQVGKSSLSGMRMLHQLRGIVPIWPFDPIPKTGPMLIEIYTSIAAHAAGRPKGRSKMRCADSVNAALLALGSPPCKPHGNYDDHSSDALITAAWLRIAAHNPALWAPKLLSDKIAATEGWTFGVA